VCDIDEMETNLIQIISACVIIGASLIPLRFALRIKVDKQRILSSLLFIALVAYTIFSLLESFGFVNYNIFAKISFIVFAFGLMTSYFIYQLKANHVIVGGVFGIAMIVAFGTWMAIELAEATILMDDEESHEIAENVGSIVMMGFGIFLITRFFWLRSIMPIEPKYTRN
jgi:hypothetical protein